MKSMRLMPWGRSCALTAALLIANSAFAETNTATTSEKDSLELEKLRWAVAKDRADYYKGLVPDLSAYQREAPSSAPPVAATTTRVAYLQAQELAKTIAAQIDNKLPLATTLLLDSPHLLVYQSSLSSVESLLASNSKSVQALSANLAKALSTPDPQPHPTAQPTAKGSDGAAKSGAAVALPLLQLGFSVASAVRSNYVMGGTSHESLSTKILQAQVIAALEAKKVLVYDTGAVITWPQPGEQRLNDAVSTLEKDVAAARGLVLSANDRVKKLTEKAKPKDPKGDPDPVLTEFAEWIAAQAKLLAADAEAAGKYAVAVQTPGEDGMTPLVAAKRGLWLREKLAATPQPARLSVASAVAATDIVAADGWIKGLRVAVAGNTIVEWRLVFPDGRVATGTAQSCSKPDDPTCGYVVLRPDTQVK